MNDRDELLNILQAIWDRRASTSEVGNGYAVILDDDLCDRIRRVLGEELWGHNQEPLAWVLGDEQCGSK